MLQELYVNNYKCLVNFTLPIKNINLVLGRNGTGKSTAFEVLSRLQSFIAGNERLTRIFPPDTLTIWLKSQLQHFELRLNVEDRAYHYKLILEHNSNKVLCRVQLEQLTIDGNLLFEFENGTARLFHDDFTKGPEYPFDWSQSGLATLQSRPDNQLLTLFKQQINGMVIIKPNPAMMISESTSEENFLSIDCTNFASWYRFLSQENQAEIFELTHKLREVIDGFYSFKLMQSGEETKSLQVGFISENNELIHYRFKELSDGQRIIILLYTLLYVINRKGACLCIDEPENYLALPEIQPWLITLFDICQERNIQAIIASHHPEIIDYLAADSGQWFERFPNSPTRVRQISENGDFGIKISELVARGWINE
ncbi:MAG: ATP-binding protein [Chlorobium sp.]|nr:MAG: ATP-binding protein [Chlorobium sp.]